MKHLTVLPSFTAVLWTLLEGRLLHTHGETRWLTCELFAKAAGSSALGRVDRMKFSDMNVVSQRGFRPLSPQHGDSLDYENLQFLIDDE